MATKKKARRSAKKKSSGSRGGEKETRPTRRETGAQVRRPAGEAQTLVEEGRAQGQTGREEIREEIREEGARPQAREEVRFPEDRQEGGSPQGSDPDRTGPQTGPEEGSRRVQAVRRRSRRRRLEIGRALQREPPELGRHPRRAGARARGRRGPPGGPSPVERFGSGRRFRAGRGEEERARRRVVGLTQPRSSQD